VTTAVTKQPDAEPYFTAEQVGILKRQFLKPRDREPSDDELAIFLYQCERTKLDPFVRQIYAIYRWDGRTRSERMQVETTIDGFRLVAERTGKYEGQHGPFWRKAGTPWDDVWLDEEPPAAAKVGVWMAGAREPTFGVAHWSEYAQRGKNGALMGLWPTMPANQLAKCAEALALRKAFPRELSGLYTREEMSQADNASPPGVATAEPVPVASIESRARDLSRAEVSAAKTSAPTNGEAAAHEAAAEAAATKPPDGMRDPDSPASEDEIGALRELIKLTNTHEGFVRMALIDFGIEDVGEVDDLLPRLTVAQALHVMNRINERASA
jgi:phage recombination protein Bet